MYGSCCRGVQKTSEPKSPRKAGVRRRKARRHVDTQPFAATLVSFTLKSERRYQLFQILDCQNICE